MSSHGTYCTKRWVTLLVAMHVSSLVQLILCSCLLMSVFVCMYVRGRVGAYVHVNSNRGKKVLILSSTTFCSLVGSCQPYMLPCSARGLSTHLIRFLSVSRSVVLHRK